MWSATEPAALREHKRSSLCDGERGRHISVLIKRQRVVHNTRELCPTDAASQTAQHTAHTAQASTPGRSPISRRKQSKQSLTEVSGLDVSQQITSGVRFVVGCQIVHSQRQRFHRCGGSSITCARVRGWHITQAQGHHDAYRCTSAKRWTPVTPHSTAQQCTAPQVSRRPSAGSRSAQGQERIPSPRFGTARTDSARDRPTASHTLLEWPQSVGATTQSQTQTADERQGTSGEHSAQPNHIPSCRSLPASNCARLS
jgi:hypothetical protein